jgi:uncharacterized lipoprotein YajG
LTIGRTDTVSWERAMNPHERLFSIPLAAAMTLLAACSPTADPEEAAISTQVKAALQADEVIRGAPIVVDTHEGTVTLSGTVGTRADRQRAEQIALKVEGVRMVRNKLDAN